MRKVVSLVLIVCALFAAACDAAHHQAPKKETAVVVLASEQADAMLKKYATQGWRCVGVRTGTPINPLGLERGYLLARTND